MIGSSFGNVHIAIPMLLCVLDWRSREVILENTFIMNDSLVLYFYFF